MRKVLAFFILPAVICLLTSFNKYPGHPKPPKIRTIIIDPGHGGIDPGTHGLISKEKKVALEISLKLGDAIEKEFPDIKIVYTRTTDELPGNAATVGQALLNRAAVANKAKGDLFICIHCNATRQHAGSYYMKKVIGHKKVIRYVGRGKKRKKQLVNEPVYRSYLVKNMRVGTETYIWKADRSGFKEDAINQKDEGGGEEIIEDTDTSAGNKNNTELNVEAFDLTGPESKIRAQLYEKKFFNNSALLASFVEDEFKKSGRESYGVKQRDEGIRVLQATGMPSILIETGFLTNKEEEEYLNSNKGQREVVQSIIEALKRYKESIENENAGSGATVGYR